MYLVDDRSRKVTIEFSDLPETWHIATPLLAVSASKYQAETYDRLVDSPVEIGTFEESDFDESGAHYRVIIDADPSDYVMQNIVIDLHKIVAAATSWMNDRPFDSYMFLYHFPRDRLAEAWSILTQPPSISTPTRSRTIRCPARSDRARILSSVEREAHPPADSRTR